VLAVQKEVVGVVVGREEETVGVFTSLCVCV
jgi:hypothetical protein